MGVQIEADGYFVLSDMLGWKGRVERDIRRREDRRVCGKLGSVPETMICQIQRLGVHGEG